MTTPSHSIQSGLIQYFIYPKWYLILIAVVLGAIPDLGRLFQKDTSDWNEFYVPAHDFIHHWWLLLIPFWNLHIVEDYFMHNQKYPYGWYKGMVYVEIVTDLILAIIILKVI